MPFQIIRGDIKAVKTGAVILEEPIRPWGRLSGFHKNPENLHRPVIRKADGFSAQYAVYAALPSGKGDGTGGDMEKAVYEAYTHALALVEEKHITSAAIPVFSHDRENAFREKRLKGLVSAVRQFLLNSEMDVYLITEDRNQIVRSQNRLQAVCDYIDANYEDAGPLLMSGAPLAAESMYKETCEREFPAGKAMLREDARPYTVRTLEGLLDNMAETFAQMLIRLIDEKGRTDADVYKKANIDRKLFSKIRSNRNYNPKKTTVLALAVSLELSLDETRDLLARAGYAFSASCKSDIIVQYFIERRDYDLFLINETLFFFEQPLLGSLQK